MDPQVGTGSAAHAALPSPFPRAALVEEESKAERRRRKEAERLLESRLLDPWERYRALADHVAHLLDVTELADRKTRFALVILGTLNAINLLVAIRAPELGSALTPVALQTYVAAYALLSLYAFVFAIIALRPRPQEIAGAVLTRDESRPLMLLSGMPDGDADSYYDSWRQAELSQINRELAMRSHLLATANAAKFQALQRVYQGLMVLVALTATLAIFVGFAAMFHS